MVDRGTPARTSSRKDMQVGILAVVGFALLVYGYWWFYKRVSDAQGLQREAEGARFASDSNSARAAFDRAIALAPDCKSQDITYDCTLSGARFLAGYLDERPQARSELCSFTQGEHPAAVSEWIEARCTALGHAGQGCCRHVFHWLTRTCSPK